MEFPNASVRISFCSKSQRAGDSQPRESYKHQSEPRALLLTSHTPFCSGLVTLAHVPLAQGGPSLPATLTKLHGTEHSETGPCRSPHSTHVTPQRTGRDKGGRQANRITISSTISQHLGRESSWEGGAGGSGFCRAQAGGGTYTSGQVCL